MSVSYFLPRGGPSIKIGGAEEASMNINRSTDMAFSTYDENILAYQLGVRAHDSEGIVSEQHDIFVERFESLQHRPFEIYQSRTKGKYVKLVLG